MTEYLTINREWTEGYEAYTKTFTLAELKVLKSLLDLEDVSDNSDGFTEFITGHNCDTYADDAAEMLEEMYNDLSHIDEEEYKLNNAYVRCMNMDEFKTCYTVFRLWNIELTPQEAEVAWKESCLETLAGLVEG